MMLHWLPQPMRILRVADNVQVETKRGATVARLGNCEAESVGEMGDGCAFLLLISPCQLRP